MTAATGCTWPACDCGNGRAECPRLECLKKNAATGPAAGSKHTPGPWFDHGFNEDGLDGERVVAQRHHESMGYAVACVLPCGEPDSRPRVTEANARLIAAAPAMDLALSMLACGIARIERCGRLEEFCFDGIRYCLNGDWNALFDVIGWDKARAAIAKATGATP